MAYPISGGGNEINKRKATPAEAGFAGFPEDNYDRIRDENFIFHHLGIKIDEDGRIPRTDNINPSIFMVAPDENGIDRITTVEGAGFKYGTPAFWDQVAMGNVFAYPAGEKDPVQLQIKQRTSGTYELLSSKPITADNFPASPAKKPSLWQRFRHFISRGKAYAKEWNAYYRRDEGKQRIADKLYDLKGQRTENVLKKETETADRQLKEYAVQKQKEADAAVVETAEKNANAKTKGLDNATSVWKPTADFREEFHKGPGKYGLYSTEQFNDLKQYGKDQIDLSTINVGNTGKPFTDEEFACAAMFAGWDPKIASQGVKYGASVDIHAEKSFVNAGIPAEETQAIMGANARSMFTTDYFNDIPRDNSGTYFKECVNGGKKNAVEAFQAYKNGDKSKLGKILAFGINEAAKEMCTRESKDISFNTIGTLMMTEKAVEILKKDPELMEEAKKQGMDPKKFKVAEGMVELNRLDTESREAKLALAQDAYGENRNKLTSEQKAEHLKKIVKADLAMQRLVADNMDEPEEVMNKTIELTMKMQVFRKDDEKKWSEDPSSRPEPQKGKIWSDSAAKATEYFKQQYRNLPKSVSDLTDPKYRQDLDKVCDQIVKQEDLAGKTSKELYDGLNSGTLINVADSAQKAIQTLASPEQKKNAGLEVPEQPKAENAPKQAGGIADRAKQFENGPQAGGPTA